MTSTWPCLEFVRADLSSFLNSSCCSCVDRKRMTLTWPCLAFMKDTEKGAWSLSEDGDGVCDAEGRPLMWSAVSSCRTPTWPWSVFVQGNSDGTWPSAQDIGGAVDDAKGWPLMWPAVSFPLRSVRTAFL